MGDMPKAGDWAEFAFEVEPGLECLNVYGQSTNGIPRQPLDGSVHTKAIYVARAA